MTRPGENERLALVAPAGFAFHDLPPVHKHVQVGHQTLHSNSLHLLPCLQSCIEPLMEFRHAVLLMVPSSRPRPGACAALYFYQPHFLLQSLSQSFRPWCIIAPSFVETLCTAHQEGLADEWLEHHTCRLGDTRNGRLFNLGFTLSHVSPRYILRILLDRISRYL